MQNRTAPLLSFGLLAMLLMAACKEEIIEPTCIATGAGTVTDKDGNIYETVVIGTQEWMVENLRTTQYANGDAVPNVTDGAEWQVLSSGAWCWFDNDDRYDDPYGKLYNWYAATDSAGLCPTGWHVPTDEDWKTLEIYLGMDSIDADSSGFLFRGIAQNVGGKMRAVGTDYWISPNDSATNESCFTGLPGGGRYIVDGAFSNIGYYGSWWSSTERNATTAWYRSVSSENGSFSKSGYKLQYGVSVRCIRN